MMTKSQHLYTLYRASNERDLEAVRRFLARGDNVNFDGEGHRPIHGACRMRWTVIGDHQPAPRTEILQELLEAGANINATRGGYTALHIACEHKLTEVVQFLISKGANVNLLTDSLESPLLCVFTNDEVADNMLSLHRKRCGQGSTCTECRSPERYPDRGMTDVKTPIRVTEMAQALLDGGADPNAQSLVPEDAFSVLHYASKYPEDAFSALHYACKYEDEDLIKLLIEKGANVVVKNACGDTPLHTLLKMDEKNSYKGNLSLSPDVLSAFLKAGFDLQTHGEDECSVLHYACPWADPASVLLLISHGADVKAVNGDKETPLHCVLEKENFLSLSNRHSTVVRSPNMAVSIAGHLLDAGADIEAKNACGFLGQTPLMKVCLCRCEFSDVAELLVARGADGTGLQTLTYNSRGPVGETHFHRLCHSGGARLVGRLCDLGIVLPSVIHPTYISTFQPYISMASIWEDLAVVVVLCRAGVEITESIHDRAVRFLSYSRFGSEVQVKFFSAYTTFVYAVNPVNGACHHLVLKEASRDPRLSGFTAELEDRMMTPAPLQRQAVYVIRRILGGSVSGRRRSLLPGISALGDVRPRILPSLLVDTLRLSAETDTLLAIIPSRR